MFRYYPEARLLVLAVLVSLATTACSVRPASDHLSSVSGGDDKLVPSATPAASDPTASVSASSGTVNLNGERADLAAEEVIARESLVAWRRAIAHVKRGGLAEKEWHKLRTEDEKAALDALKSLESRYPTASSVKLMMGQVEEHHGKPKEAALYYKKANEHNVNNTLYTFKLAESLRTAGNTIEAEGYYRGLLKSTPDFAPAQVGLAQCLLSQDPASAEARTLAAAALKSEPESKSAKALAAKLGL